MDRLDAMKVLVRVADLGSFTKAAEDLALPRATVTLAVQRLERRLGVRLLQRTTRHVSPTPDGQAYVERCRQLLADADEAEAAFDRNAASPRGRLRVDLHGTLAAHFLLPHLGEFTARHPDIELEIGMGDRLVDLVRERIDCVLRAGEPKDSSMVARRVALLPQVTCASRAYLDAHGVPRSLQELGGHRAVNFLNPQGRPFPFDFLVAGEARSLTLNGKVAVSHAEAYVLCCEAGLGLIQVPRYHVGRQLDEGRIVEVLADLRPAPMPASVLYPHHRQLSARVRVFVDWVADRFARDGYGAPESALPARRAARTGGRAAPS